MKGLDYFKNDWKNREKQALLFLLKLIILQGSVKLLFFLFNYRLLEKPSFSKALQMAGWSFYYDLLVVLAINLPYFILLWLASFVKRNWLLKPFHTIFIFVNSIAVLINLSDVFYFPFHGQRADADLVYVLGNPFGKLIQHPFLSLAALVVSAGVFLLVFRFHRGLIRKREPGMPFIYSFTLLAGIVFCLNISPRKFVPTYPLTTLNSGQLQFVENSFHTFLYSMFRQGNMVRPFKWMSDERAEAFISNKKMIRSGESRNVVLFIMESVPEDYFQPSGKYKVRMPFIDSLLEHSTYFENAFSFSHNSNKGIVAILAGLPTLTEIPLYHSSYTNIPKTGIGELLAGKGYTSAFFIGDNFDDFGFAKCCNWLGIQHYYCKENIPGFNKLPAHTMGIHDEYVLDFAGSRINEMKQPFFAVHYNISTHYPNDLPAGYTVSFPAENVSPGMKSMEYYSESLRSFFAKAKSTDWYSNTVFVFCSDHWMYPDASSPKSDLVQRFRIPVFIFDPAKNSRENIISPVSQLDIMNTVLSLTGINDSVISYGENLLDRQRGNRTVYMKENSTLYQAIDSNYVIGYSTENNQVEFIYEYKKDKERKIDLSPVSPQTQYLLDSLKAFLQVASQHYNKSSP